MKTFPFPRLTIFAAILAFFALAGCQTDGPEIIEMPKLPKNWVCNTTTPAGVTVFIQKENPDGYGGKDIAGRNFDAEVVFGCFWMALQPPTQPMNIPYEPTPSSNLSET